MRIYVALPLALLLLSLSLAMIAHDPSHEHGHSSEHRCIHSQVSHAQMHQTVARYDNHPWEAPEGKPRALKQQTGTFSPFRIKPYLFPSAAGIPMLANDVVPRTVQFFSNFLKVIPVDGALKLDRRCTAYWSNGRCAAVQESMTCSTFTSTPIPAQHLSEQCVYEDSSSSCNIKPGGAGVADADFILYVVAEQTQTCINSPDTLAYATGCVNDQYDRPVAGFVNFCNSALSLPADTLFVTSRHEVTHALGFSSDYYPLYRDSFGKPRTPREANGLPPIDSVTNRYIASNSTLTTFFERGHMVEKMITPNALAQARIHFGCDNLNGVELEDYGGAGSASEHWEKRIFMNEYMTATKSNYPSFSSITLGLFEDMGWYEANYAAATALNWGRSAGCSFALDKCLGAIPSGSSNPLPLSPLFCSEKDRRGCSADGHSNGQCAIDTYTEALPSYFQYFSVATQGGRSGFADFCPTFLYAPSLDCHTQTSQSADEANGNFPGNTSSCFNTDNFLAEGYTFQDPSQTANGVCFPYTCSNGVLTLTVVDKTVVCPGSGGTKSVSGYQGSIICPAYVDSVCYTASTANRVTPSPTVAPTPLCAPSTTLSDASGSFEDGSGGGSYVQNSQCTWLIKPTSQGADAVVRLVFSVVDLEPGMTDYIQVYTGSSAVEANLLGTISTKDNVQVPDSAPTQYNGAFLSLPGQPLFVRFVTDSSSNFGGFSASYSVIEAAPPAGGSSCPIDCPTNSRCDPSNPSAGCVCLGNFKAPLCVECKTFYYGSACDKFCNPATTCSGHGACESGNCMCNFNYVGPKCDSCKVSHFGVDCAYFVAPIEMTTATITAADTTSTVLTIGGNTLTIPIGTVGTAAVVVFQYFSNDVLPLPSGNLTPLNQTVWELAPHGTTFKSPIEFKLSLSNLPNGTLETIQADDTQELRIARWNETSRQWKELESTLASDGSSITTRLLQFSRFTVVQRGPPITPAPSPQIGIVDWIEQNWWVIVVALGVLLFIVIAIFCACKFKKRKRSKRSQGQSQGGRPMKRV